MFYIVHYTNIFSFVWKRKTVFEYCDKLADISPIYMFQTKYMFELHRINANLNLIFNLLNVIRRAVYVFLSSLLLFTDMCMRYEQLGRNTISALCYFFPRVTFFWNAFVHWAYALLHKWSKFRKLLYACKYSDAFIFQF